MEKKKTLTLCDRPIFVKVCRITLRESNAKLLSKTKVKNKQLPIINTRREKISQHKCFLQFSIAQFISSSHKEEKQTNTVPSIRLACDITWQSKCTSKMMTQLPKRTKNNSSNCFLKYMNYFHNKTADTQHV